MPVLVCTVVGFPLGANASEMKAAEAQWVARAQTLREATGGALGSRWLD